MDTTKTSPQGWGLLSKYRVELMGAAILWIVLYHGYRNDMIFPEKLDFINFILSDGVIGVEIFLLLSGLGLYYSFSQNSNLKEFYKKRVKRVILPYLLVSGCFWIGQDILYHKNIITFLKNITLYSFWTEGYDRLWYFALLIPLYLIFPFLYYFIYGKEKNTFSKNQVLLRASTLIGISLLLNFIVRYVSKSYYELSEIALSRIPIFLLGILIGSYAKRNEKVSYGAMVLTIIAYSLRFYDYENDLGGMFMRYWYIPGGLIACFLLIYLFEKLDIQSKPNCILSKILTTAGKYSMELYIVHIWIRKLFNTLSIDYDFHGKNLNKYGILDYFLVILFSLFLTFLFAQIEKLLFRSHTSK